MSNLVEQGNNFLAPDRPALEIITVWVNPNSSNLLAKVTVEVTRWGLTLADYFVFPPAAPMVNLAIAKPAGSS